jgi:hypothetical protein
MKQKNPIRNEIVYLWKQEQIPKNHPLPLEREINSDEEYPKTSGEISGKKFLIKKKDKERNSLQEKGLRNDKPVQL